MWLIEKKIFKKYFKIIKIKLKVVKAVLKAKNKIVILKETKYQKFWVKNKVKIFRFKKVVQIIYSKEKISMKK